MAGFYPRHLWHVLVLAGILLGSVNVLSNHGVGPASDYVSKVIGNDWAWLLAAYGGARAGKSFLSSVVASIVVLYPAVFAYYVGEWWFGRNANVPGAPVGAYADSGVWVIVSSVIAVIVGILVTWERQEGVLGAFAATIVPAYITWRTYETHSWLNGTPATDPSLARVTGALWPIGLLITLLLGFRLVARILLRVNGGRLRSVARSHH